MISRRRMIVGSAAALAGIQAMVHETLSQPAAAVSRAGSGFVPVVTPNGSTLRYEIDGGVKVFRLVAEPVNREFSPGMMVNCWGYNGQTPGPTIEAVEGDRVRIFLTNKLPEPTAIHWHGMIVPNGMDGVGGVTQPHIKPDETFVYEFDLKQHGTHMYHPHSDEMIQMAMGMHGFFIIHPREARPESDRIDRDFCIFLHEWFVPPGASTTNPMVMTDFNLFTFNSRVFPGTEPLIVKLGQRVRIRFANLSMDNHPIHFHGHRGWITGTDGDEIPASARWPISTIDVPPGTTRDLEFIADNPGDWPVHCHKNHHAMNAMSHDVPNLIGAKLNDLDPQMRALLPSYMSMGETGMGGMMRMALPKNTLPMMTGTGQFGPIQMGGMFTILKIREGIQNYNDPGWYQNPNGSVARKI